ncbi:MAG: hypothetical protein HYV40_04260, partial [Candidatus Levybacteria bacterium]|nr:hypothetical protein [Candidatus Levybacteria bacterium]
MTKEAVFGVQARMVRLTPTPEASSNTLVRGGVFLMPQVDGGNNEIQGLGHQAAPKNGDIHAARSELKLNVLQTPDEIIANLPFATPREPLSQKIVDIYKAAVEVTPVERWKQEHYEKALAGVNEVAIEAQGGLTAEPKEAAMGVAGDILLRADRSGQDVFAIYKNATKSLVEKHKLPIPSDEEMLTALTVQIAALA